MQNEGTLELTGSTLNAGLSNAGLLHVRYNRSYLKGGFTAAAGDTVRLDESSSLEVASGFTNHGTIDFASSSNVLQRSEERRVGKEGRARWGLESCKKKFAGMPVNR